MKNYRLGHDSNIAKETLLFLKHMLERNPTPLTCRKRYAYVLRIVNTVAGPSSSFGRATD
jgi:hypothetical protein